MPATVRLREQRDGRQLTQALADHVRTGWHRGPGRAGEATSAHMGVGAVRSGGGAPRGLCRLGGGGVPLGPEGLAFPQGLQGAMRHASCTAGPVA